jgi:hypothetical protein
VDRETFILTRQQIQAGMEEKRRGISLHPHPTQSNGFLTAMPFMFSVLKTLLNPYKPTLTKTILTTVGFRFLSPFIARNVRSLFSKAKS